MKKSIIRLACLFVLISSPLLAQQRWSGGPRLGLNLSTAAGDIDNTKLTPGLAVGGFVMYSDINHFGVSVDLLYSQRGFRYKQADRFGDVDFRQRLHYVELPILLRYFLNRSGKVRPNLFLGPNVGFLVGANRPNPVNNALPGISTVDLFNKVDLGATAGLSLNFRVRQAQRLHVDARYTLGLTDITKNQPGSDRTIYDNTANGNVRNSVISLTLGYGIGLGRSY